MMDSNQIGHAGHTPTQPGKSRPADSHTDLNDKNLPERRLSPVMSGLTWTHRR